MQTVTASERFRCLLHYSSAKVAAAAIETFALLRKRQLLGVRADKVLLVFAGLMMVGLTLHPLGRARSEPNRAIYEHLLAGTHAVPQPDGTILIQDANGASLSLTIDYWKDEDGRPSVPFVYEFKLHYDQVAILPEDDPWKSSREADYGMQLVPTAGFTLSEAPDGTFSEAIKRLVEQSIADARSGTASRYDVAASSGSSVYFLRCDPARNLFYLLLRQHTQFNNLQAMQNAANLGYIMPVTDFQRAHLWRYFVDHFTELGQLAEKQLAAKRAAGRNIQK